MRTHKKTWLACLLTVSMLLSLVPMSAFAANDAVTDEAGLRAAIAEGGEITLGESIFISEPITVTKDLTIDLNSHKIELPSGFGYVAEAAFIVSGADLVIDGMTRTDFYDDIGVRYAGSGSTFKLIGVADATTSLTINGGDYSAYDNWNEGAFEYPISLFNVVAEEGTVQPTITLNSGSYFTSKCDAQTGHGVPGGPLISGVTTALAVSGGTYYVDPTPWLTDDVFSFEQDWGGEWMVLSESTEYSADFLSILAEDKTLQLKRYAPQTKSDLYYFFDALMTEYNDYESEEAFTFTFYLATWDADEQSMLCSMIDKQNGMLLETHKVVFVFNFDNGFKAEVDKIIEGLPEGEDMGDWIEPYYFAVNDLELINYWLTCSEEVDNTNKFINYSEEFKKLIGYKNFILDARMGWGDMFITETAGIADFIYGGTVYGSAEFGARAHHILYVPDDATDAFAAAQARVDAYLGEGKVVLEDCGSVLEMYQHLYYEHDEEWQEQNPNGTFDDYVASGACDGIDVEMESSIEGLSPDTACVKTTINGLEYYMLIEKDGDKLTTPTYQNVDVNTDIAVKSEDTSIPLDTMLEVECLTSGAEYDRIQSILKAEESETYDIKLHSGSLGEYITELDNGEFEVNIPIPEKFEGKDLNVYYVDAQGVVTTHVVTPKDGYASFITTHFSVYTLVADGVVPDHSHAYADKWESDKDNHWHACSCGEKDGVAAHTFKDGKCSVCGAVADDAGESPLTGDAGIPVLVIVLALVGVLTVALTVKGKKKAEK